MINNLMVNTRATRLGEHVVEGFQDPIELVRVEPLDRFAPSS
jgi:hypothetical protein